MKLETVLPTGHRESVIACVYVALALALPLLSHPLALLPFDAVAQRFDFRFPWTELAAAILLLALLLERNQPLRLPHHGRSLILALFGYLFLQTISALLADTPCVQLGWILRATSNLILTLVATHFLPPAALSRVATAWTVAATLEALFMLAQSAWPVETVGTIGNRNFAAAYLALSLPIGWARLSSIAQRQERLSVRWLGWWLLALNYACLLIAAMVAARSRGAVAAVVLVAAAWAVMQLRRQVRWMAVGVALLAFIVVSMDRPTQQRIENLWRNDVRPMIWLGTLRTFAAAPLLGHGPDSFLRVYPAHRPPEYFDRPKAAAVTDHAHNEFLEIAAETGAIGLIAFLALLVAGARAARQAVSGAPDASSRRLALGVTLGLAVLLLQNLVDINLRLPPNQTLFWIGLGWLGAAMSATRVATHASTDYRMRPFARLVAWPVAIFIFVFGVGRPVLSDWCFREGQLIYREGHFAEAEDYLKLVTRIDPDRVEGWRQLGVVAERLHHRQLAVESFRIAHRLAPDYANLNGELATLLALEQHYDEAVTLLVRATRVQPRNATNFAWLAYVRLRLGQPDAARVALNEALRLEPANPLARDVARDFTKLQPPARSALP